ncbi:MAG: hypothetical protein ABI877_01400 [Gemmatimonadaceae bacterium]
MRESIQLFRSLTFRQIVGLQLVWTSTLGLVFAFVTWLSERDFHPEKTLNVVYSLSLRWQLEKSEILALAAIVAAPLLLWIAVRDRSPSRQ